MEKSLAILFEDVDLKIKKINPDRILLQIPSGLKRRSVELADEIRKRYGCEVLISGDSCYGACDIISPSFPIDAIIQVGHAPMNTPKSKVPVIFIPVRIDIDLKAMMPSAIQKLISPVGILATAQHLHQIDDAKKILEENGLKVVIGKGSKRLASPGHILGCDYSAAKAISDRVKSFLLLGGGEFHALGAYLTSRKPVVIFDPERTQAISEKLDMDYFLKRRFAMIQSVKNASAIGILVSTKAGQNRLKLAEKLKDAAVSRKKKCEIIILDEITSEKLMDLGFKAYISTACPRIALDDSMRFGYPIGTPAEFLIALEDMNWDDYQIDDWNFGMSRRKRRK